MSAMNNKGKEWKIYNSSILSDKYPINSNDTVIVSKPGYYNEHNIYAYDKNHIIYCDNSDGVDNRRKVHTDDNMIMYTYNEHDNVDIKILLGKLMTLYPKITVPLVLFRVLSILKPLLRQSGFNVDGLLFLYGVTGSLKTSFSSLIMPDNDSIIKAIAASKSDLYAKADRYKDGLIILDDIKLLNNKYKNGNIVDFLDVVVRCEDLDSYPSVLVTSEIVIGSESLQDRMILVHADVRVKDHSREVLKELYELCKDKDTINTLWYSVAYQIYSNKSETLSFLESNYDLLYGNNNDYRIYKNVGALKLSYILLKHYFGEFLNSNNEKELYTVLESIINDQIMYVNMQRAKEFNCNWAQELKRILESNAFQVVLEESEIVSKGDLLYIPSRSFDKMILLYYYPEKMNITKICEELFTLGILHVTESKGYTSKYNGKHHYVINRARMKLL